MNISSVNPGCPPSSSKPCQGAGTEAKIRSLEQKLQNLNTEKEKAVRQKNKELEEKLEKQIQEIEKQIQQLRQQEKKAEKGTGPNASVPEKASEKPSDPESYIDVYA